MDPLENFSFKAAPGVHVSLRAYGQVLTFPKVPNERHKLFVELFYLALRTPLERPLGWSFNLAERTSTYHFPAECDALALSSWTQFVPGVFKAFRCDIW